MANTLREREIEREAEDQKAREEKEAKRIGEKHRGGGQLESALQKADSMIDQVNSLFNMYIQGIERTVPIQQKKQLESLIELARKVPKTNQSAKFRFNNLQARFATYQDRWDRLLKDLESGKIKRADPKKKHR